MHDGKLNKKSGIIVILLPSAKSTAYTCAFDNEKAFYTEQKTWINIDDRAEYERRYPYMPPRIIDNLLKPGVNISVINWDKLSADVLRLMIDNAYENRANQDYDMTRPMRRRNYNL